MTNRLKQQRGAGTGSTAEEIVGTIRDHDGVPVPGATVQLFAVRLRGEQALAADVETDGKGRFCAAVELPDGTNLRVAVVDETGHAVASSPVQFGIRGGAVVDVTLPREHESVADVVAPFLDGVRAADLTDADIQHLVGVTGLPAADLKALAAEPPQTAPTSPPIVEQTRSLPDVTIRVRETDPGRFEASFVPVDPHHMARNGYTLDTQRGLRGHTVAEVLDRAEANWRQNYPDA